MEEKAPTFQIRKKIPLDILKDSIKNQLKLKGNTFQELADNKPVTQDQIISEPYPNKNTWHTLEDLKTLVAKEMQLGSELFGPNRKNDDFNRRMLNVLSNLKKENVVEEHDSYRKLAFRLIEPQEHKFVQIKPITFVIKPPPYNDSSEISFGEEKDMQRVFNTILEHGGKDNTYKFVLAKIILEYCKVHTSCVIKYKHLAEKFLEHYWYQEYRYKMKQDFKKDRKPMVINVMNDIFREKNNDDASIKEIPEDFGMVNKEQKDRAMLGILKSVFGHARKKTSLVVPRFQNIPYNDETVEYEIFYSYDDKKQKICLRPEALYFFKTNYYTLSRALITEWAKFLERINGTLPSLISKIENYNMPRGSLKQYYNMWHKWTDCCFYCGTCLEKNYTEVDHFIPWSYIFNNEPWNLVLACKSCNCKKSNHFPKVEDGFVDALVDRNEKYRAEIIELDISMVRNKTKDDWRTEIDNHYKISSTYGFTEKSMR